MNKHTYRHTVQYYETDKMGIAHHSNYVRWMEEARVDLLSKIGWDYDHVAALGVFSPVTAVGASPSGPGVRLRLKYAMTGADGTLLCEAASEHVFLNAAGKPIRMNKQYPELYRILTDMIEKEKN